jgi:hypothetical protein
MIIEKALTLAPSQHSVRDSCSLPRVSHFPSYVFCSFSQMNHPGTTVAGIFDSTLRGNGDSGQEQLQNNCEDKTSVDEPDNSAAALAAAAFQQAETRDIVHPNAEPASAPEADIAPRIEPNTESGLEHDVACEAQLTVHHDDPNDHNHRALHHARESLQSESATGPLPGASASGVHTSTMFPVCCPLPAAGELNSDTLQFSAGSAPYGSVDVVPMAGIDEECSGKLAKTKRRQYKTEEERRQARIIKNRRTAEESRQRRLRRLKYLEDEARINGDRARELELQVIALKAEIADLRAGKAGDAH